MSDLGLLLVLAPLGLELGLPDPVARRSKAVTEAKFFFSFTPGRLELRDELEKCWVDARCPLVGSGSSIHRKNTNTVSTTKSSQKLH